MTWPDPARFGKAAAPLFGTDETIAVCAYPGTLALMESIGIKGLVVKDAKKFGRFLEDHMTSLTVMDFIIPWTPGEEDAAICIGEVLRDLGKSLVSAPLIAADASPETAVRSVQRALMLENMTRLRLFDKVPQKQKTISKGFRL